jgi:hypothetical protein
MYPKTKTQQLQQMEEVCGEFLGFEISDDQIIVTLRQSWLIRVSFSSDNLHLIQNLRRGDQVGILTDDANRIRARKV